MRQNNMIENTINNLKAKLESAKEEITYHVDKNGSLQREIEYVSSDRWKKANILERINKNLKDELSETKDALKNQYRANADFERRMDNASDEFVKKQDRLNQTIKNLEAELKTTKSKQDGLNQTIKNLDAELKITKSELKDQVIANTLAVAETTSLKNQIETSAVENIELKKQKDCEINVLKQLLGNVNVENKELKQQIATSRREINNYKMKWQNARKKFGELERIHKMKDTLMKTIKSSFSSDNHLDVNAPQSSKCPNFVNFHITIKCVSWIPCFMKVKS